MLHISKDINVGKVLDNTKEVSLQHSGTDADDPVVVIETILLYAGILKSIH